MTTPDTNTSAQQYDSAQELRRVLEAAALLNQLRVQTPDAPRVTPSTDVAKQKVTLRDALALVAIALSIAGGAWASTSGLRSDVRNILTVMAAETKAVEAREKYLDQIAAQRDEAWKASIRDLRYQQSLFDGQLKALQDQIADLRERMLAAGGQLQRGKP